MSARLRAPFPYYGSKIAAAPLIEQLHGDVNNLVVPFAGSLGELLGRSRPAKVETVNDLDGLVVNAWRGLAYSPARMAELCDHPVHETTLHAAHDLLVARAEELPDLLASHPRAHDVELAAWWVWGRSAWLGGGWCDAGEQASAGASGGMRVRVQGREGTPYHGQGVARRHRTHRKMPRIQGRGSPSSADGVHEGVGVVGYQRTRRQLPLLRGGSGLPGHGCGVHSSDHREALLDYFAALAQRLRWVRITCGDWSRVLTRAVTTSHGLTGVSLDPGYDHALRSKRLYRLDAPGVSADVRAWALEHGSDPLLRITLAGKYDEHDELLAHGWARHEWRKDGEVIWSSPHCRSKAAEMGPLFGGGL